MSEKIGVECFAKILDRSRQLIQTRIWDGICIENLLSWKNNFVTDEQKIFAAYVLDQLVYRNHNHMVAMFYDILTKRLHNVWRIESNDLYKDTANPLMLLKNKYGEIGLRYMAAVKEDDPETKSGYRMVNLLNHQLQVSVNWNIRIKNINDAYTQKNIKNFILFDDIICTGDQMCETLARINFTQFHDAHFYVCVCAAHEVGLKKIKELYPYVSVISAEKIPAQMNAFDLIRAHDLNLENIAAIREWYAEYMKSIHYRGPNINGKGDLAMLYAFQESVPNNSLPILFHQNTNKPLLLKRG